MAQQYSYIKFYYTAIKTHDNITSQQHLQFDDMRMPEELEILDFSADFANHIKVLNLLPVQNLHSHFVTGHLMSGDWNRKYDELESYTAIWISYLTRHSDNGFLDTRSQKKRLQHCKINENCF